MTEWNLSGKAPELAYEKVLVPIQVYEKATIKSIDLIDAKDYETKQPVKKWLIMFSLTHEDKEVELPYYLSDKVSKGTGKYSNSKMYDLLEYFNLIEKFTGNEEQFANSEIFKDALEKNIKGKDAKILTKIAKKNTDEAYSVVDKLLPK